MSSVIAIVPARSGSSRVPGKIHAQIAGQSLVERKLSQLVRVVAISDIVLATDDPSLRPVAVNHGAAFLLRPPEWADERSYTPNDLKRWILSHPNCPPSRLSSPVIWAHPTNPLVGPTHYAQALEAYARDPARGLCSVTRMHGHFWGRYHAINYDPSATPHQRAADLPPLYAQDGAIFIRRRCDFATDGNFVGPDPIRFEIPAEAGWDINEPWELQVAMCLTAGQPVTLNEGAIEQEQEQKAKAEEAEDS